MVGMYKIQILTEKASLARDLLYFKGKFNLKGDSVSKNFRDSDNHKNPDRLITRLIDIIRRQYGGSPKWIPLNQIDKDKDFFKKKAPLYTPLQELPTCVDGKIFFPIDDQNGLEMRNQSLSESDVKQIRDLISLVTSLRTQSKQQLGRLKAIEDYTQQNHNEYNNIIPLLSIRTSRGPRLNKIDFWGRTPPSYLLIEGFNHKEIYKSAFKYHYNKSRYAFLHYSDLDIQSHKAMETLKSLGNVTLYIPDMAELSDKDTEILMQLLDNPKEAPSLICGIIRHHFQPKAMTPKQRELMERLSKNRLRLEVPYRGPSPS